MIKHIYLYEGLIPPKIMVENPKSEKYTHNKAILDWIESDEGKKHTACGLIRIDKLIEFLNDGKVK